MKPDVSIIVPSRGRPERLGRLIACLAAQEAAPGASFEAIVALDGCSDAERAALPETAAFPLVYLPLPQVGISAAKNAAIARSSGRILLFVNDDVEPAPDFVRQHVAAQDAGHPLVLGASPWLAFPDPTVLDELIARTRMIFFYDDLAPGRLYDFRHAWNLNLSVARELLAGAAAPFDEAFRPCMYEDLVFAHRLIGTEAKVYYHPAAMAVHHHRYDLRAYFEREALLGMMAPQLAERARPCFAAIFGGALDDLAARARATVEVDVPDKRRALAMLTGQASQAWHSATDDACASAWLDALYHAHLPLKRHAFRVGLLAALAHPETPWPQRPALAQDALGRDPVFANDPPRST